ncbi:MAG: PilN domain-containing protein [Pseudomonadota bacterium]
MPFHSTFQHVAKHLVLFWAWWKAELTSLIPLRWQQRLAPKQECIGLSVSETHIDILKTSPSQNNTFVKLKSIPVSEVHAIHECLKNIKSNNNNLQYGLILSKTDCVQRHLTFPKASKDKIRDILSLDLEHATPFKAKNVFHDFSIMGQDQDKDILDVTHIIVKKMILNEKREQLAPYNIALSNVDVFQEDHERTHHVNLIHSEHERITGNTITARIALVLCIAIFSLGISALIQVFHNQSQTLAQLDQKIASVRKTALSITKQQRALEQTRTTFQTLLKKKQNIPQFLDIWRNITQELPDTASIDSLKKDRKTIQISGFAASAENIIQLLSKSEMFAEVKFTSPVRMDQQKNKERFRILLKLASEGKASDG